MSLALEQVKIFSESKSYKSAEDRVNTWLAEMHPSIDITRVLQTDSAHGSIVITIFYRARHDEPRAR